MDRRCTQHTNQEIIFICLFADCLQNRLGCQKCLLSKHSKCIRGCLFLNDLNEEAFAWSGQASDLAIQQFILTKVTGAAEIDKNIDELITLVLNLTKQAKKEVLMKRIQCKSDIQKQAKTHLNQYAKSFSVEGLKDVVMEFHNGKITEVQATQQITQLSKQRADLEDQSNKGKILTILPSLHKDDIKSKERDILTELSNLQNIFQFSQGWQFIKSTLSKQSHCAITEVVQGCEYVFNEQDKWQLIYGTQRWKDGVHQWLITVNLVDAPPQEGPEDVVVAVQEDGLESIIQGNAAFGGVAGSTMYANAEYKQLNRLYIGIVADSKKDQQNKYSHNPTYASYITGSQGCEGLDVIRGQLFGNMYMCGGASQQVNNVFKAKKKNGITFTCSLNVETKHFSVKDKDGQTSYESTYYQQGVLDWRPFVLSVKSKVIVKLEV